MAAGTHITPEEDLSLYPQLSFPISTFCSIQTSLLLASVAHIQCWFALGLLTHIPVSGNTLTDIPDDILYVIQTYHFLGVLQSSYVFNQD
jgi:Leucine-rich repeat (LRR) protein